MFNLFYKDFQMIVLGSCYDCIRIRVGFSKDFNMMILRFDLDVITIFSNILLRFDYDLNTISLRC